MPDPCFICGGTDFGHVTPEYRQCRRCGHETLVASNAQAFMLNDPLRAAETKKVSALDRFQDAVLRKSSEDQSGQWVDIGSGSGKLLFRNRNRFAQAWGIEITPEAADFSRQELGLSIASDLAEVPGEIALATAWHSLEHFPAPALESLLANLRAKLRPDGRIVVSVPNGASFQYRWFGGHYAFFDVPNHLQQFTPDSLDRLFEAHGFRRTHDFVSWPYNLFGYAQALLNLVMPVHNYVYYRLKRGIPSQSRGQDIAGWCLLPFAAALALPLGLLDAASRPRQAVITCCYKRKRA